MKPSHLQGHKNHHTLPSAVSCIATQSNRHVHAMMQECCKIFSSTIIHGLSICSHIIIIQSLVWSTAIHWTLQLGVNGGRELVFTRRRCLHPSLTYLACSHMLVKVQATAFVIRFVFVLDFRTSCPVCISSQVLAVTPLVLLPTHRDCWHWMGVHLQSLQQHLNNN